MKGIRALFYFGLALACCVVSAMASTRIERDISVHGGNSTGPAVTAVASESIIGTKVLTGAVIKNGTVLGQHMVHKNVGQKVMAQNAAKEEAHKYNNGERKAKEQAYVPTTVHPTHGLPTVGGYKPSRRNHLDMSYPIEAYNSADRHEDIVNVEITANPTHGLHTVGSNKPRRNQLDMSHPIEAYTAVHQVSAPHINLYQRIMGHYPNAIQENVLDPIASRVIPPKVDNEEYRIYRHRADRQEDIPNVQRYAPAEYGLKPQLSVKEFDAARDTFPEQYPEGAAAETERANGNYLAQKYMEERMQKEKYSFAGVLNAIKKDADLDRTYMQLRRNVLDASRIADDNKVQDFEKQFMQHKLAELKEELESYARQLAVMIEQQLESDEILRSELRAELKDKHVRRPPAAAATKNTYAAERDSEDIVDAAKVSINSDEEYNQAAQSLMEAGENIEQLMKLDSLVDLINGNNQGIVAAGRILKKRFKRQSEPN